MKRWTSILLPFAVAVSMFIACAPAPKPVIVGQPTPRQIRYLGEISGKLGDSYLSSPVAISYDQQNDLYVVDQGNSRIVKLGPEYQFLKENGGFGLGISGLSRPTDIVSDGGINFYVLDQGNNRIVRSDRDLVFADEVRFNSNPDLQALGKIAAIGYARTGRMYLVDPDNLKVIVLDKDYKIEQELLPPGGFSHCSAIYVTDEGDVYVYDRNDETLYKFDTFGNAAGKIQLQGIETLGGFVVHGKEIIATDKATSEVLLFDLNGTRLASLGSAGSGPMNLSAPSGIARRNDGKLFVCDTGNNRVMIYEVAAK